MGNKSSNEEIERRWLVKELPPQVNLSKLRFTDIQQSYICRKPVLRLRSHDNKEFVLCVKTQGDKTSLARPEQEISISKKEYKSLMRLSTTEPIIKRRHFLKYKKFNVEIDIFGGYLTGLIIFEVEFHSELEAHAFEAPEWFGKEITGIRKYANSSLEKKKNK